MAQLCLAAQDLYHDTKYLYRVPNKDDPYAMVAINKDSEPYE
jgi:hypothetical protein